MAAADTPLAARLVRSANWVTPNGSASSSGFVRPRLMISAGETPSVPAMWLSAPSTWCAGYVSLPAGTGVWVVNTVRRRAISSAADSEPLPLYSRRASSSDTNAAWPSLRCTMLGSIPSASSARTPPMPSSRYCASRVSSSPM